MKVLCSLMLFVVFTAEAATLKMIKGSVTVNSVKVDIERTVSSGDIISAIGNKSSVQIFFDDGSRTLLRNGQVIISEEKKNERTLLSLVKGLLFTYKEKNQTKLEVKTKYATLGVRGTKFYVEESPEESYLCVCDGSVEIKNSKSTVLVEKNEDVHVKPEKSFEKTEAKEDMMKMAWEGFKEMGYLRK